MVMGRHSHRWLRLVILLVFLVIVAVLSLFVESLGDKTSWKPLVLSPTKAQQLAAKSSERSLAPPGVLENDPYLASVQPIFTASCIACHGCLNSPCLLKLTSYDGLMRGARKENPDGPHIWPEEPVRMNDAPSLQAWRERGFHPVVEKKGTPAERVEQSELCAMVAAGKAAGFDRKGIEPLYKRRESHDCPCDEDVREWIRKHPYGGMPFGLPKISTEEMSTLNQWVGQGSPGPSLEAQVALETIRHPEAVAKWEAFFNRDEVRGALVSRYIYEHVFLARLSLKEAPGEVFTLVRSATPPGEAIAEIVTSRPFDDPFFDPKVKKVYYRLRKVTEPYVQKSHFVWNLDDAALKRLDELFFQSEWTTQESAAKNYSTSNPFEVFRDIPATSRSRFMLENSKLMISGMIQGPVCIGKTATYAIKDYFWIFYLDPEVDPSVLDPELGMKSWKAFMDYSVWSNESYEDAYAKMLGKYKLDQFKVSDIWNGNRQDPNAWLTVLRNETNAHVIYGRQGGIPPTFWIIDYSGFERLYYSLVVMYSYWGGVEEKVTTWTFMTFLRQEFEDNFLRLLPPDERKFYHKKWTEGLGADLLFLMPFPGEDDGVDAKMRAHDPISNVLVQIQRRMGDQVSGPQDKLNTPVGEKAPLDTGKPVETFEEFEKAVSTLTMVRDKVYNRYLPSIVFVKVNRDTGKAKQWPTLGTDLARDISKMNLGLENTQWRDELVGDDSYRVYTFIANRAYKFNNVIFDQNGAYEWRLNTMSIYHGLVGDFPNNFIEIDLSQTNDFVREFAAIRNEEDWKQWKYRYAVLRNQEKVWPMLDFFNAWNFANRKADAGYFDMTYYDLFDGVY